MKVFYGYFLSTLLMVRHQSMQCLIIKRGQMRGDLFLELLDLLTKACNLLTNVTCVLSTISKKATTAHTYIHQRERAEEREGGPAGLRSSDNQKRQCVECLRGLLVDPLVVKINLVCVALRGVLLTQVMQEVNVGPMQWTWFIYSQHELLAHTKRRGLQTDGAEIRPQVENHGRRGCR